MVDGLPEDPLAAMSETLNNVTGLAHKLVDDAHDRRDQPRAVAVALASVTSDRCG